MHKVTNTPNQEACFTPHTPIQPIVPRYHHPFSHPAAQAGEQDFISSSNSRSEGVSRLSELLVILISTPRSNTSDMLHGPVRSAKGRLKPN